MSVVIGIDRETATPGDNELPEADERQRQINQIIGALFFSGENSSQKYANTNLAEITDVTHLELAEALGAHSLLALSDWNTEGSSIVAFDPLTGELVERVGYILHPAFTEREESLIDLAYDVKPERPKTHEGSKLGLETEVLVIDQDGVFVDAYGCLTRLTEQEEPLPFRFAPEKDYFMLEFASDPHDTALEAVSDLFRQVHAAEAYLYEKFGWYIVPASTTMHTVGTAHTTPHPYVKKIVDRANSIDPNYMLEFAILTTQANKDAPSPAIGRELLNRTRVVFSVMQGLSMAAPAGFDEITGTYSERPFHQSNAFGGSTTYTEPLPIDSMEVLKREYELLRDGIVTHPARIGDAYKLSANHLPRSKAFGVEEGFDTFGGDFKLMLIHQILDQNLHRQFVNAIVSNRQAELGACLPRMISDDFDRMLLVADKLTKEISAQKYDAVIECVNGEVVSAIDLLHDLIDFAQNGRFLLDAEREHYALPDGAKQKILSFAKKPSQAQFDSLENTSAPFMYDNLPTAAAGYRDDTPGTVNDFVRMRGLRLVNELVHQYRIQNGEPDESALRAIHKRAITEIMLDWARASKAEHDQLASEDFDSDGQSIALKRWLTS